MERSNKLGLSQLWKGASHLNVEVGSPPSSLSQSPQSPSHMEGEKIQRVVGNWKEQNEWWTSASSASGKISNAATILDGEAFSRVSSLVSMPTQEDSGKVDIARSNETFIDTAGIFLIDEEERASVSSNNSVCSNSSRLSDKEEEQLNQVFERIAKYKNNKKKVTLDPSIVERDYPSAISHTQSSRSIDDVKEVQLLYIECETKEKGLSSPMSAMRLESLKHALESKNKVVFGQGSGSLASQGKKESFRKDVAGFIELYDKVISLAYEDEQFEKSQKASINSFQEVCLQSLDADQRSRVKEARDINELERHYDREEIFFQNYLKMEEESSEKFKKTKLKRAASFEAKAKVWRHELGESEAFQEEVLKEFHKMYFTLQPYSATDSIGEIDEQAIKYWSRYLENDKPAIKERLSTTYLEEGYVGSFKKLYNS